MDYNELLTQVASMLEVQTEKIDQKLQEQAEKFDQKIDQKLQEQAEKIDQKIDQKLQEQAEKIYQKIDQKLQEQTEKFDQKLQEQTEKFDQKLQEQAEKFDQKLQEQSRDLKLYIENNVSKKIESLFDGYKLVHEKQWEQEKEIDNLKNDVDILRAEVYALKQKVS